MLQALVLIAFVAICLGAGFLGQFATRPALRDWYPKLVKPTWNPPQWVFAPVWTLLYILMGVAAWLCWLQVGIGYGYWLFVFSLQLLLNLAWSFLFFEIRNLRLALIEVVVLWIWIAVTIAVFAQISSIAAWLMIPYLVWVAFAAALNFAVYRLNLTTSKTSGSRPT
jgi:tryptophan-rich sensory protein